MRRVPQGEDLAPLAAIHAACFPDPWGAKALADLLATPGTFMLAEAVGFVMARTAAGEAEILTLAVSPPARRRGLAASLVREAASHAQQAGAETLFLEVAAGNDAARALYTSLGFAEAGLRRAYYTVGRDVPEDALVLRANLPLPPAWPAR
jgi:ribosomal-protein-alanine N-acetyltransferase